MLDFRNLNTLWASVLVETLFHCGLRSVVVCPGSRSAPLAVAFARHPAIEAIPVLDERSAAFFALGLARRTHEPVALVCTSGTAGANFYPAIIEARESRVPLLVLTADRPPELRDCNAGQAIDQQKLFGDYVNAYAELALPKVPLLGYLRQRVAQFYQQAIYPIAGAVHLNLPFRDPLAPVPQAEIQSLADMFPPDFFHHLSPDLSHQSIAPIPDAWRYRKGIIIAGVACPDDAEFYASAIGKLSQILGYPVLAEGLSPVRNFAQLQPYLIATYDTLLRHSENAIALRPDIVIRIGEMPTSKALREWLAKIDVPTWVVDPSPRSLDPLHNKTTPIFTTIGDLLGLDDIAAASPSPYLNRWLALEKGTRLKINATLSAMPEMRESKVAWLLAKVLPESTALFVANSMPVRDVEYFWQPNDRAIQIYANRGANGIDGTVSTAMGVAHRGQPTVLLTGDLSLLHDTNGLLLLPQFQGSLTIVLINNNGGGIFGMLPIANFEPPFEAFFVTPQDVPFDALCQTYGVDYQLINTWQQLETALENIQKPGVRLLEIKTDRVADANWRKENLSRLGSISA
jgi:2-succinyl-5-enolpyruvyl-6-hydroxy-3-cyclohexene-1-carboxylate synthase